MAYDYDRRAAEVGKFTLPADHLFGMAVPKGGSACDKCRFVGKDGKSCSNEYFVNWRKSLKVENPSEIPAPIEEYCCDVFQKMPG
jgi:hypothetical protein